MGGRTIIRFRAYGSRGLSAGEIAVLVTITTFTFLVGAFALGGIVTIVRPEVVQRYFDVAEWVAVLVGLGLLAVPLFYLAGSLFHFKPLTIGANCAFGADLLRPYLTELAKTADTLILAYPNAGLPNELGQYDELPAKTAQLIGEWLELGLVNAVGGCCGTTPDHIAAIARAVQGAKPRPIPVLEPMTRLAGLEPFTMAA